MANVKKIYDMVVVTGTYTNKAGEEKKSLQISENFSLWMTTRFFQK